MGRLLVVLVALVAFAACMSVPDTGSLASLPPISSVGAAALVEEPTPTLETPKSMVSEFHPTSQSDTHVALPTVEKSVFPFAKGIPPKSVLVAVETAPDHYHARASMRDVMKQYQQSHLISKNDLVGITMKFFIGEIKDVSVELRVQTEAQESGDIVRLTGFEESYFNLTRKSLAIIVWAKENGYASVYKSDDDSFFCLDNFIQFLKTEMHPQNIYAGQFITDGPVIDNPDSKWFNYDRYPHPTYPDYASGPGYYLGSAVIDYLYSRRSELVIHRVEDAGVGIWTQGMPNIDRVNIGAMTYFHECQDTSDTIYLNPVNSDEMLTLMQNVIKGDICSNRFQLSICRDMPCLCHPIPDFCEYTSSETWSDFSQEQYQDIVPRLLQVEKGVVTKQSDTDTPAPAPAASSLADDSVSHVQADTPTPATADAVTPDAAADDAPAVTVTTVSEAEIDLDAEVIVLHKVSTDAAATDAAAVNATAGAEEPAKENDAETKIDISTTSDQSHTNHDTPQISSTTVGPHVSQVAASHNVPIFNLDH